MVPPTNIVQLIFDLSQIMVKIFLFFFKYIFRYSDPILCALSFAGVFNAAGWPNRE